MPFEVNGQIVDEELILRESARIERDPRWQTIEDAEERARQLRWAAEMRPPIRF